MTRKATPPAAEAAPLPPDPDAGKGGSYVRDPLTGVRTLKQRTQAEAAAPKPSKEK